MSNSSCTTLIVTPKASADGKMRVAHSCDDALADHRMIYVPAQDWPEGAKRPVYPCGICEKALPQWNAYIIPRCYIPGRSDEYADSLGQAVPTIPIGEIPQVRHTYAYLDANYAVMNEVGLMFGECTSTAKNLCPPEPGKRLFYSAELARIALERCAKAEEAVELMGDLLVEYGYYGTGETLLVADANDAWVMEMAPTDEGDSGLWVARRVPDGEFFVEANLLRIRELKLDSPDYKMCPRIRAEVENNPAYDWVADRSQGEYHHPYYSMRRVWRAMDLVAPSKKFSPKVDGYLSREYPFSVAPDRPIELEQLFAIYRDHLEGTEFDMTKGAAGGPWGNPNHPRPTDEEKKIGAWERPISMVDTGYAYICEAGGICWTAMGRPAEVPFVPLAVAPLPPAFSHGSPRTFDPEHCAWWRYNLVSQISELRYCDMIQEISRCQQMAEGRARLALEHGENSPVHLNALAERTLVEWKELFEHLMVAYNQGYYNTEEEFSQRKSCNPEFLKAVGFLEGPTKY